MRTTRWVLVLVLLVFAGWTTPCAVTAQPKQKPGVVLTLDFAVAHLPTPVVTKEWIAAQVEEANQLFAAVPLSFVQGTMEPAPWLPRSIVTREDRDRAMGRLKRGHIHIRVVAELLDVDEPGRVRRGVHWRRQGHKEQHYIVLSAIAGPSVLAHELGHFFELGHSPVPDNLMSYERTGGAVFLDASQVAIIRRSLLRYLRSGELLARRPSIGWYRIEDHVNSPLVVRPKRQSRTWLRDLWASHTTGGSPGAALPGPL